MSAVGDTSASNAATSFGNTVLSVVRKVFSSSAVRWRSTSVSETCSTSGDVIDRSTSSAAESTVVGNAGSDLNGNDSLSSFNSTKCLLGDAATTLRCTVCPRCGCSLNVDPAHGVQTTMTVMVDDKLKPVPYSTTMSCIRCGWASSAVHIFPPAGDDTPESIKAGEPVCVCSACSRARTAMIGSLCDLGADSASSASSTTSLVMEFSSSSSDASSAPLPSSGPRPLSTGKHRKSRHVTATQILQSVPASNRSVQSAVGSHRSATLSPSMPTTADIYFLPPHIAVSRDGEEGFARSQRRLARLNRVVDSSSVQVPPNRTVRHITGFDT